MFLSFPAFVIFCSFLWDGWSYNKGEACRSHILVRRTLQMVVTSRNKRNRRVFLNDANSSFSDTTSQRSSENTISMPPAVQFPTTSRIKSLYSPSSIKFETQSRVSSTSYGISKISLTTLLIKLYPSMDYDIGEDSIHNLVNLTRKNINEYVEEQLQPTPLDSLEEMILQSVFIGIKFNFSSQNSTQCAESSYLYCVSLSLSSEAEILGLDTYSESQIENYRHLLINYLSIFFSDTSVDAEDTPKLSFLDILQNSDDNYLMDIIALDVAILNEGYNPFTTRDSIRNHQIVENTFSEMIQSSMWVFFFSAIFILVGGFFYVARSYWHAQQTALLKIHVETTVDALGNNHMK